MSAPANRLPRWRGFNLLEKFSAHGEGIRPFQEEDFSLLAEWGFDWVRLPMTYMAWTDPNDLYAIDERQLCEIDQAVEFGRQYGIHVNISFHRAPGFSVNRERVEPFNLWRDQAAVDCCIHHWQTFARRYKGVPSERVSFNLWNEPERPTSEKMTVQDHERVARQVVAAIRDIDPDRLIIADGLTWGTVPLPELADLPIAQSCRGYYPVELTHYQACWNDPGTYPPPAWPVPPRRKRTDGSLVSTPDGCDRRQLQKFYRPWADLMVRGIGVHCGEMGVYNRTPHGVSLAWMEDVLSVLKDNGIGYALWNFRGSFGLLDSERADVRYEDFRGHKLDREMLELLRRY